MRALLLVLALALLVALLYWAGRALRTDPAGAVGLEGHATRALDQAVMDVTDAVLVAGPPQEHACLEEPTAAAIEGLARRLSVDGLGPAMRRGTRPRPTITVRRVVPFAKRRTPLADLDPAPDCTIHLALARFELDAWTPPTGSSAGRADFTVTGRVWVLLPGAGPERTFFGDFTGRHELLFEARELEGAPAAPELAAAFLFGRRLLETWRRGLVWREP